MFGLEIIVDLCMMNEENTLNNNEKKHRINKWNKIKTIISSAFIKLKIPMLIIILVAFFLFVLFLPFIINCIYSKEPPLDFFDIGFPDSHNGYTPSDILTYYGTAMSLIVTSMLTVIIIIQTKKANLKNEEVDELKLRLAQKQFEMAKSINNIVDENNAIIPKFEIKIIGYSGNYANLRLKFKNVARFYVSCLSGISFDILDEDNKVLKYMDGTIIPQAKKFSFEKRSLRSGEETVVEIDTPNMRKEGFICNSNQRQVLPKNVSMKFTFSCENELGQVLYFSAETQIPDTKIFDGDLWICKREA